MEYYVEDVNGIRYGPTNKETAEEQIKHLVFNRGQDEAGILVFYTESVMFTVNKEFKEVHIYFD